MTLPNQFSLSLELTKLMPLKLTVDKATEAVMLLARQLRNTGSDIVIEEDLAFLMGRLRVTDKMSTSFRTALSRDAAGKAPEFMKLSEDIVLESGIGPTVGRSLKSDQTAYFSTIVQCSLLSYNHEINLLAAEIAYTLEQGLEAADQSTRISHGAPSQEGIAGVLRACEDQTAAYKWFAQLEAVALELGLTTQIANTSLPSALIRGAFLMLPLVQHLPENRKIIISTWTEGLCTFIVWAHHIAGLNVVARCKSSPDESDIEGATNHFNDIIFGNGNAEVVVEYYLHRPMRSASFEPSMTLLDVDSGERMFVLQMEDNEPEMESACRLPLKGYGKYHLADIWYGHWNTYNDQDPPGMVSCLSEVANTVVAFALLANDKLTNELKCSRSKNQGDSSTSSHATTFAKQTIAATPRRKATIISAAKMLFDGLNIRDTQVQDFVALYDSAALQNISAPSAVQTSFARSESAVEDLWVDEFMPLIFRLTTLVLTLTHVSDMNEVGNLPLDAPAALGTHSLCLQLQQWDGRCPLMIQEMVWFEALAHLTISDGTLIDDSYLNSVSAVSNKGWCIFLNTFTPADPFATDSSSICVKPGIPARNGVRKHTIMDGPYGVHGNLQLTNEFKPGDKVSPKCNANVALGKTLYGEKGDAFIVNVRFNIKLREKKMSLHTGLRELQSALWLVTRLAECAHPAKLHPDFVLPVGSIGIVGDGIDLPYDRNVSKAHKLTVFFCSTNRAARWKSLISIARSAAHWEEASCILLRGPLTCVECTMREAHLFQGRSYIVL